MASNWTEEFLEEIANQSFPQGLRQEKVREREFLLRRFHPDNCNQGFKKHTEIAQAMSKEVPSLKDQDLTNSITTTCQNVVRAIVEKYEPKMKADGIDVDSFSKGEVGQKGHWQKIYNWLHNQLFPRWRTERIWQTWQQQANPNRDWINFEEIKIDKRTGLRMPMRKPESVPRNQIEIKKPLQIKIELDNQDCYLLLLNRGWNSEGEETTRYLLCPSYAFAPKLEPIKRFLFLPQDGAQEQQIEFDATGKDDYIGIVLRQEPNYFDWMMPNKHNTAPSWNETHIYQLWQELEQQSDWQVFYQSFAIVEPDS
jgi:hypothetical protein